MGPLLLLRNAACTLVSPSLELKITADTLVGAHSFVLKNTANSLV